MDIQGKQKRSRTGAVARLGGFAVAGAIVWFSGAVADAHDPSQHSAKATRGVVSRTSPEAVTVTEGGGETTYMLSPDTRVVRNGERLDAVDLKPGTGVAVYATKLPGGKAAATEINIVDSREAEEGTSHEEGHAHGTGGGHAG